MINIYNIPTCLINLIYEFSACNSSGCRKIGNNRYMADSTDLHINEGLDAFNGFYCDEHMDELEEHIDELEDYIDNEFHNISSNTYDKYVEDWDY